MDSGGAIAPFRVVFVCTGNICRSPMAEIVMRAYAEQTGLGARVRASSAATSEWHVGESADHRTVAALARRGFDGTHHRARQVTTATFCDNDLVVALDRTHERALRHWAPSETDADKVSLLLSYEPQPPAVLDVPDPYYAEDPMFDEVLAMIESATRALFRQLEPAIRPA